MTEQEQLVRLAKRAWCGRRWIACFTGLSCNSELNLPASGPVLSNHPMESWILLVPFRVCLVPEQRPVPRKVWSPSFPQPAATLLP